AAPVPRAASPWRRSRSVGRTATPRRSARPRSGRGACRCRRSLPCSTVELGREEKRRRLQDLVRPTQLSILTLELLPPRPPVGGDPRPPALIDLAPTYPDAQRLGRAADLRSDRDDRRPLRLVLMLMLEHQPHRPLTNLWRVPPRCA